MPPRKKAGSAGNNGPKHEVTPKQEKSQNTPKKGETKSGAEDNLRQKIKDLENEVMLWKNGFNIKNIMESLEQSGIQVEDMTSTMYRDNILAYLKRILEELETQNTALKEKPSVPQHKTPTDEDLKASQEEVKKKEKKIVELENDKKKLTDRLKALEDQSSHSSEHKKQDDSLKEALREWENKYNAVLKVKDTAINERNELREKVEHLETEAKKQSLSPEQEKTIDSLKEANIEWENKCKAAEQEQKDANKNLETMRQRVEQLEKEAKNQSKEATTVQKVEDQVPENDVEDSKIKSLEEKLKKKKTEIRQLKAEVEKQSEKLQQTVKINQSEISTLKDEITSLTEERDNLNKNLKDMKETLRTASNDAGLKESNEKLSTELTDIKRKYKELEKENVRLQKSCDDTTAKLTEKETKISQMEKEYKHVVEEKNREIEKLQKEKSIADSKQGANANGNAKGLKEKFDTVNTELQHAKEEISELKNRLSKVVGAKVMDDNPNIADLSDENRPTKLSEKYSELYDNEWTDAFEELENNKKNETDVIQELYKLLIDINASCQQLAKSHADNIKSSVLSVPSDANGRPKTPQIGVTQARLLKELRKTFAPFLVDSVFQHFVKTKKIVTKSKPKTEAFVKECVKICWLMNAQDPPVVIDTSNAKGNFDDNRFRTYTKSGKTVDFVVWPPLLLHNDGPLLCKGVAQGK